MNLMENEKLPDVEDKTVIDFESLTRRLVIDYEHITYYKEGYLPYKNYTQQEKEYLVVVISEVWFFDEETGKDYP